MNKKALDAFIDRLRQGLPTLKEIVLGWPGEGDYEYPFLACMVISSYPRRFQSSPQLLRSDRDEHTFLTAVVNSNLHLRHYFQSEEDSLTFNNDLAILFNDPLADHRGLLSLKYGNYPEEVAEFRLIGTELETDTQGQRIGERQTISRISAVTNETATQSKKLPTRIILDPYINERQVING